MDLGADLFAAIGEDHLLRSTSHTQQAKKLWRLSKALTARSTKGELLRLPLAPPST